MKKTNLKTTWDVQYEGDNETALKDRNLFTKEVDALMSQLVANIPDKKIVRILELGCGTGYLLNMVNLLLNKQKGYKYFLVGVDFSKKAITKARDRALQNTRFECCNFFDFLEQTKDEFDVILSQRSVMAMMSAEDQERLLLQIRKVLSQEGVVIMSECFAGSFGLFNSFRHLAGLPALEKVWHSYHLDEMMLDRLFNTVSYVDYCSTYMLITRLIYPFFEEPKHNQAIHDLAARLPENGNISYLKIAILRP